MKQLFVAAFLVLPLVVSAEAKPEDPLRFSQLSGEYSFNAIVDYCYMNNAYLAVEKDGQVVSMSSIWNFDKNRPFTCAEYTEQKKALKSSYKEKLDAYYEENPKEPLGHYKKQ